MEEKPHLTLPYDLLYLEAIIAKPHLTLPYDLLYLDA